MAENLQKLARAGYCAEFAVALQRIYGYPPAAFFLQEPNPDYGGPVGGGQDEWGEPELLVGPYVHVFAVLSDTHGLDVDGPQTVEALAQRLLVPPGLGVILAPTTEADLDAASMEGLDEALVARMMTYIHKQASP